CVPQVDVLRRLVEREGATESLVPMQFFRVELPGGDREVNRDAHPLQARTNLSHEEMSDGTRRQRRDLFRRFRASRSVEFPICAPREPNSGSAASSPGQDRATRLKIGCSRTPRADKVRGEADLRRAGL